ncbi:hypothetical protein JRC04_05225 [Mycolicibacterium sp. S2-37]|uniref:hypothetical protein n=1 Tax=Mycolicibacterium sp. S2-37 TaxID=2810297 RepID=UPI001A94A0A6|nr:hypothetical protein [Mycolicibacterium sp. S2-37]MBO0676856.1 hypothetical protein [Mycolicibacterium sp. S2-37]
MAITVEQAFHEVMDESSGALLTIAVGVLVAASEMRDEYPTEDDAPEGLVKFLKRVETASEEFLAFANIE